MSYGSQPASEPGRKGQAEEAGVTRYVHYGLDGAPHVQSGSLTLSLIRSLTLSLTRSLTLTLTCMSASTRKAPRGPVSRPARPHALISAESVTALGAMPAWRSGEAETQG